MKDREKITVIIKNVDEKETETKGNKSGRKMNFAREGKKIPHTITNIPMEGVYLGVCEDDMMWCDLIWHE